MKFCPYLCIRISRSDTRNDIRKDLTPPSDLKNPTGSYIVGFFFFVAPSERTADRDKGEESTELRTG